MGKEIRINDQVSIVIRRHSTAMVEVYRHGVLVWKTIVPLSMQHSTQHGYQTRRRHVTVHPGGTLECIDDVGVCRTNLSAGEAGQHS